MNVSEDKEQRFAQLQRAVRGAVASVDRNWDRFDKALVLDPDTRYPNQFLFGSVSYYASTLERYVVALEDRLGIDDFSKIYDARQKQDNADV